MGPPGPPPPGMAWCGGGPNWAGDTAVGSLIGEPAGGGVTPGCSAGGTLEEISKAFCGHYKAKKKTCHWSLPEAITEKSINN